MGHTAGRCDPGTSGGWGGGGIDEWVSWLGPADGVGGGQID